MTLFSHTYREKSQKIGGFGTALAATLANRIALPANCPALLASHGPHSISIPALPASHGQSWFTLLHAVTSLGAITILDLRAIAGASLCTVTSNGVKDSNGTKSTTTLLSATSPSSVVLPAAVP